MSFELRRRCAHGWASSVEGELLLVDFEEEVVVTRTISEGISMSSVGISPKHYREHTVPVSESDVTPEDLFRLDDDFLTELRKLWAGN